MNDEQGILRRLEHYADCIEKGVHVTGTQLKSLVKDIRESGLISSQQPPSAPVGAEGFDAWFDEYTKNNYTDEMLAEAAWKAALAHQPAADGGFTAADMMDARQEGRKEAEARAERLAEALREAMEWNWIDGDVPETIQDKARAALRDHDQEVGES